MRIIPTPGRSPTASAPSAVSAAEPFGASTRARSASRPTAIVPVSRRWTRAVLPVARHTAFSGAIPPSEARWAIVRRMPSGTTPVPDGASMPRITRSERAGLAGEADRVERGPAVAAVDDLDRHPARDQRSMSRVGQRGGAAVDVADDVGSRLEHDVRADGARARRWTGRRCGTSTTMPCCRAHSSIGAASAPVFTEPRPTSPTRLTPAARQLREVLPPRGPSSRIGAPACTFTPAGRTLA